MSIGISLKKTLLVVYMKSRPWPCEGWESADQNEVTYSWVNIIGRHLLGCQSLMKTCDAHVKSQRWSPSSKRHLGGWEAFIGIELMMTLCDTYTKCQPRCLDARGGNC